MPDVATAAVMRDLAAFAFCAMMVGVVAYTLLRLARPGLGSVKGGAVAAHWYDVRDVWAAVALMMFMLMTSGILMSDIVPPAQEDKAGSDPGKELLVVVASIVTLLMICGLLLVFLRAMRGLNPVEIFGMRRVSLWHAARLAMAFIVPMYVIVVVVSGLLIQNWLADVWPDLGPQEAVTAFQEAGGPLMKTLMIVAAVIVAPVVEETIFRGYVYAVLKRFTDGWFAAVCSSLLFAVVHVHVGSTVPLFLLALGFCAAYEFSGSLLVPMWMHAFFNATSMALISVMPENLP
jgi:membrane protease YdiL (CAAX protease family)